MGGGLGAKRGDLPVRAEGAYFQRTRSAGLFSHTRPAKGRLPWTVTLPWLRNTMEYSISNPSYSGVQGLPFPIPDIPILDIHVTTD